MPSASSSSRELPGRPVDGGDQAVVLGEPVRRRRARATSAARSAGSSPAGRSAASSARRTPAAARSAAGSSVQVGGHRSMVHHAARPPWPFGETDPTRSARRGDDRAQLRRRPRASSMVGASTITRTSCSVPDGPQQHPAGVAEARLGGGDGVADGGRRGHGVLVGDRGRSPAPAAGPSRRRRGRRGSCRSGPCGPSGAARSAGRRRWWRSAGSTTCPDCSPPSANPPARSSSSTYRSPTWVVRNVMPCSRIARCRPRLLMTVATSVSSTSSPASCIATASTAMIWSPSTSRPSASTARQRSASPSWAMPRSAPCARTAARSGVEVGRADAVVDVEPVRVGVQRDDLRAGARVAVGGDGRRGAVGAVDDHPQPGQRLRGARQQVRHVPRLRRPARSRTRPIAGAGRAGERARRGPPRRRARRRRAACGRPPRRA